MPSEREKISLGSMYKIGCKSNFRMSTKASLGTPKCNIPSVVLTIVAPFGSLNLF